jgi:plasmid stabilization system protein ParE
MAFKLEYLPSAERDILDAEAYLYDLSPSAADKFVDKIPDLTDLLCEHPFMCQVYLDDNYFRSMNLPYDYRLFYHVDEETETIKVHRVIHGMRDINKILYD